jgi:protein TonB
MKSFLFCLGFLALAAGVFAADKAAAVPVKNEVKFTGEYFLSDQLDTRPAIKQQTVPRFPSDMSRDQTKGRVEIAFIVNAKGVPEEVQVAAATSRSFGEAAVSAVKQWRFKPGKKGGVAVRTAILQELEFAYGN